MGYFETVADFTLESEAAQIVANFPAVTDFILEVIVPSQSVNNNAVETTIAYNVGDGRTFKMSSAFSNSYRTYNVLSVSVRNGVFFAEYATALNQQTNRVGIADRYPVNLGYREAEPINKLTYRAGGTTFPVGTKVTVKGVRA